MEALPGRRRRFPTRIAAALSGLVAIGTLASGCGSGSTGSHVAQLGSTTSATNNSPSTGSGGASTVGEATTSQALAYAHCMRSHGVPSFPDPNSSGSIPKTQVGTARQSDPSRFDSADTACRHLLPRGGGNGETPAQIQQDYISFRKFARCMRSHGVSNWPDPTNRSPTDHRPNFNLQGIGLDGNSPQLKSKAQQCASQVHIGGLPPAAGPAPPTGTSG
jgi:hypothetical protein